MMTPVSKTTLDWSTLYHGNLMWLPTHTIFLTRAGSHAYGLATPESDLDVRGMTIPPKEYFLGFRCISLVEEILATSGMASESTF